MSSSSPSTDIALETIYKYARSLFGISEQFLSGIPGLLHSLDRDLDGYRDEISRLENQLQSARVRYEEAQEKAIALRSLLAPIHRLPNELLTQIFDSPFCLSAVCSRWRSLCLLHSKVWSKIAVDCIEGSELGNAVDLYIERSKPQLLTIHISYLPNGLFHRGEHSMLLQKLVSSCARWRHVTLSLESLSREIPYLSGLDFPALESLNFEKAKDSVADLGIFTRSPTLQTLNAYTRLIPNQEVLGRIIKLSLLSGGMHQVLRLCSNIQTLTISEEVKGMFSFNLPAAIPVPTLTHLHVRGGNYLWSVFHSLITPALTTLHITHNGQNGDASCAYVERFLARSGCSLTNLIIEANWADKTILGLLQRLPLLEELSIWDPEMTSYSRTITEVLMESLYGDQSSHPLIPKLHSLSLMVPLTEFDHELFMDMILSRWISDEEDAASIGVSCIRSVKLRVYEDGLSSLPPRSMDEAEYLPLVQLRKMGLHLTLQC
ncbi:hypothetical protein GYMLUDRAFT_240248 [Collybiopsis luxurians FD-317 M1]|nr:hypothetical protein GYMLUDRAFT_240248 [Collybiopsis luxurians FD-317 M1]